jgi:hypothetical protein
MLSVLLILASKFNKMRNILYILVATFLLVSCTSEQVTSSAKVAENGLSGKYLIKLTEKDILEELDSSDTGGKLALSLLSLLKVHITFQENGYAKLDGEYGLLDLFEGNNSDSIVYKLEDNKLYIDNIEINNTDYFEVEEKENGVFALTTSDSTTIYLEPA